MRGPLALALSVLILSCAGPPGSGRLTFEPPRQVEVVVHSEPGGGVDLDAREWTRLLAEERLLAGSWRVENRGGGAGLRAMSYLASRRGRDDVVAVMSVTWLVTPITTREATVTYRDLTPLAMLVDEPTIVAVAAASPYRTFNDILDAARARPGRLNQVGGQVSSAHNVYRELIQEAAGVRWNFVPLASRGERLAALLGAHADFTFTEPSDIQELVRAGEVRVLAAVGTDRVSLYPEAPALDELGISVDLPKQRRGIIGPPGMTAAGVAYYEDLFRRLTSTERWAEYVRRNALRSELLVGADLARALDAEDAKLRSILARLGLAAR